MSPSLDIVRIKDGTPIVLSDDLNFGRRLDVEENLLEGLREPTHRWLDSSLDKQDVPSDFLDEGNAEAIKSNEVPEVLTSLYGLAV